MNRRILTLAKRMSTDAEVNSDPTELVNAILEQAHLDAKTIDEQGLVSYFRFSREKYGVVTRCVLGPLIANCYEDDWANALWYLTIATVPRELLVHPKTWGQVRSLLNVLEIPVAADVLSSIDVDELTRRLRDEPIVDWVDEPIVQTDVVMPFLGDLSTDSLVQLGLITPEQETAIDNLKTAKDSSDADV